MKDRLGATFVGTADGKIVGTPVGSRDEGIDVGRDEDGGTAIGDPDGEIEG